MLYRLLCLVLVAGLIGSPSWARLAWAEQISAPPRSAAATPKSRPSLIGKAFRGLSRPRPAPEGARPNVGTALRKHDRDTAGLRNAGAHLLDIGMSGGAAWGIYHAFESRTAHIKAELAEAAEVVRDDSMRHLSNLGSTGVDLVHSLVSAVLPEWVELLPNFSPGLLEGPPVASITAYLGGLAVYAGIRRTRLLNRAHDLQRAVELALRNVGQRSKSVRLSKEVAQAESVALDKDEDLTAAELEDVKRGFARATRHGPFRRAFEWIPAAWTTIPGAVAAITTYLGVAYSEMHIRFGEATTKPITPELQDPTTGDAVVAAGRTLISRTLGLGTEATPGQVAAENNVTRAVDITAVHEPMLTAGPAEAAILAGVTVAIATSALPLRARIRRLVRTLQASSTAAGESVRPTQSGNAALAEVDGAAGDE